MRKFLFMFKSVIYTLCSLVLMPKAQSIKKKSEEEFQKYCHHKANAWARLLLKATGLNVIINGKENNIDGPCLYVANHQSVVDIPLLISAINKPVGAVAKQELEKVPVLSYWCKGIGCVFLNRTNPREGIKSILQGTENLKKGQSMFIFPEGTRSQGGPIKEFKKGSVKMAIKANVPIIPITIDGTYKIYEGYKEAKKDNRDCICTFHKPIYISELSKEEQNNLSETCYEIIKSELK